MKISICFPQYNRIAYLLKSLNLIQNQSYDNIEIVISDDSSTDNTENLINTLSKTYKYPIVYYKHQKNVGYDRNFRSSIELASGDYCFILGNDDSLNQSDSITKLVNFIKLSNYPDIGFCNYVEENNTNIFTRAHITSILGSGPDTALKYYSCFSFVAGLIYKRNTFINYNTDIFDNSIYAQIAIGVNIIISGGVLFSINDALVIKDLKIDGEIVNSYKDFINKKWINYKQIDGGLKQVIDVLVRVFNEQNVLNNYYLLKIYRKIYRNTYPYWILDYKHNNALPAAAGLIHGLQPWKNKSFSSLKNLSKFEIIITWFTVSILSLLFPETIFFNYKSYLYKFFKR